MVAVAVVAVVVVVVASCVAVEQVEVLVVGWLCCYLVCGPSDYQASSRNEAVCRDRIEEYAKSINFIVNIVNIIKFIFSLKITSLVK